MFPAPGELPARGPEGALVHEIVLPFVRRRSAVPAQFTAFESTGATAPHPEDGGAGSVPDWLFAKLYCSPSHADRLLLELAKPLVEEVVAPGAADGWFFVRHSDPHWHLRLRLHGGPAALRLRVLPALRARAGEHQRQGTLWRIEFCEYDPELERHGGPAGVQAAEDLFRLDSELCLELVPLTNGDAGAQLRWQLALCGVRRLLSGLGLSLEEKRIAGGEMARIRQQSFVVDLSYEQQMAEKCRGQRHALAALLDARDDMASRLISSVAVAPLSRYSSRLGPIRGRLEDLRRAGRLTKPVPELAVEFAHMHLNRMFRTRHHEQEAVVCELLRRACASALARGGKPE